MEGGGVSGSVSAVGVNESATDMLNKSEMTEVPVLSCGDLDESDFAAVQSCSYWIEGVSMAILGCVAIVTNGLSIYVFTRKEMLNSFNLLIVVLTAVDTLFCVLLVADYSFARAFELHTVAYTLLYPHLIYPVTNIMLTASIYMTVVLGLERYIAVCFPLVHRDLASTYSSGTRVAIYAVPVAVLSVVINVPKFLETRIVVDTVAEGSVNVTTYSIEVTELRDNPVYIKFYMNVCQTLLLGVLPFLALIVFNVRIYHRFLQTRGRYKNRKNNANSNSSQAKDLQLALILVCVVCMFFVTNLPRLLLNLYELFNVDEVISCGDAFLPPVWNMCMTSVNHLLLVLNTIANFLVYCFFNDGFKRVILKLLGARGIVNAGSRTPSQQQQQQQQQQHSPKSSSQGNNNLSAKPVVVATSHSHNSCNGICLKENGTNDNSNNSSSSINNNIGPLVERKIETTAV